METNNFKQLKQNNLDEQNLIDFKNNIAEFEKLMQNVSNINFIDKKFNEFKKELQSYIESVKSMADELKDYSLVKIDIEELKEDNKKDIILCRQYLFLLSNVLINNKLIPSTKPNIVFINENKILIRNEVSKDYQFKLVDDFIINNSSKLEKILPYRVFINSEFSKYTEIDKTELESATNSINNNIDSLTEYLDATLEKYENKIDKIQDYLSGFVGESMSENIMKFLNNSIQRYSEYIDSGHISEYDKCENDFKELIYLLFITKLSIEREKDKNNKTLIGQEYNSFRNFIISLFPYPKEESRILQLIYSNCFMFIRSQELDVKNRFELERFTRCLLICEFFDQLISKYPEFKN